MSVATSSKRYAQAVFQIAKDRNSLGEWQRDLKRIAHLMQYSDFVSLVENPKLPFETKAKLTKELLGKINPLALNLTYLLIVKNKFKNAEQISKEFTYLLNEYQGVKNAEVITAIPIDSSDKKKLTQRLENIIGSKLSSEFKVDPAILGGIIAKFDGSLIDGSVRNKLEMLKKSLTGVKK